MSDMTITSAKYGTNPSGNNCSVQAVINGVSLCIPMDPANRHYAEILRQVEAGDLTIADAD